MILTLPIEICRDEIFKYLSIKDLSIVRLVCKTSKKIVDEILDNSGHRKRLIEAEISKEILDSKFIKEVCKYDHLTLEKFKDLIIFSRHPNCEYFLDKGIDTKELFINDNQLTSIPKEIGNLTQLKELNLENNQLTSLPKEIGNLTQLKGLYSCNNQLTSIPEEIGNLTQLKELHLYNNQITSIPKEIGNLTQLQELYLFDNNLTSIPKEIGDLTQLQDLNLENNQLTSLKIEKLTSLMSLHIDDNLNISTEPFIRLKHLWVGGVRIMFNSNYLNR